MSNSGLSNRFYHRIQKNSTATTSMTALRGAALYGSGGSGQTKKRKASISSAALREYGGYRNEVAVKLRSYKEFLIRSLENRKIKNEVLFNAINDLPDDDCLLHGDFHPNNILVMSDGTPIIIDFMNVCCGPALYDIARTYFLIKQFDDPLANRYLKCIDVSENDIAEYLNVIKFYRQYES